MTFDELLRFQIAHSVWSLERLIDRARALSADQVEKNLDIGPGSLRENLAHTIEVMFFFADNFAGRGYVEPAHFAALSRTLDGLSALLGEAQAVLRTAMLDACARGFDGQITWPNADAGGMPAAAAIAQVFDHAALHRTQCINMLKRMGARPVPDLDPMTFAEEGNTW